MAIAVPQLGPGPLRDFVLLLHELYDEAGQPATRIISRRINDDRRLETVSHETIGAVLRGQTPPAWGKVQSIVTVLTRMSARPRDLTTVMAQVNTLWVAARLGDAALAAEVASLGTPPSAEPRPAGPTTLPTRAADRAVEPGLPVFGRVPARNPGFTGRDGLLDTIRERLAESPTAPVVLFGVGGVGKSQTAAEFAYRSRDEYSIVWWVPADPPDRARMAIVDLAERLGIRLQRSVDLTISAVIAWLESSGQRYLLVFDDVADSEIWHLIPTIGGSVLVTTRDPAWAHASTTVGVEVPDFDRAEAIHFLRRRDQSLSAGQADRLIQEVGPLPIALEQVAALGLATGIPWDELASRIDELGPELVSAQPSGYAGTVSASFRLAREQLRAANPAAALILELFAWFGAEPVSVALLRRGRDGDLPPALARTLRNPVQLGRAVSDLSRFGLARLEVEHQRVAVQPLLRLALRGELGPDGLARARENVHQILAAADPGLPDELASLDMHAEIAAHVLPSEMVDSPHRAVQRAVFHQIRYRNLIGDDEGARHLAELAINSWRRQELLGPGDEWMLLAQRELANALRALGRYGDAHRLTAEVVDRLWNAPDYGPDHPHTLTTIVGRAADLRFAGEYEDALRLDEETSARVAERDGPESARAHRARRNLAVSLRLFGRYHEARRIDEEALARTVRQFGEAHAATLQAATALAADLYGLGDAAAADDMLRGYLGPVGTSLHRTDRAVQVARRLQAVAHRDRGEYMDALAELRGTYYDAVTVFGADDQRTLATSMSFANTLRMTGAHNEAYAQATDAVASYQRNFGPRNPLTLAAEVNLAAIQRAIGERMRSQRADAVAYDALLAALGEGHPFTVAATVNMATGLTVAGDAHRAAAMSALAVDRARRSLGPDHPLALLASANLVLDFGADGQGRAAESLLSDVLSALRRKLGAGHPWVTDVAAGVRLECVVEPPPM